MMKGRENSVFDDNVAYKNAIKKAQAEGKRVPESILIQLTLPFDCYEAFLKRYAQDYAGYMYTDTRHTVTKTDVLAQLMWMWGENYKGKFSTDILREIHPDFIKKIPEKTGRPSNNKRGRPRKKHLVNLFEEAQKAEATNQAQAQTPGQTQSNSNAPTAEQNNTENKNDNL